jgi:hypothetical protein
VSPALVEHVSVLMAANVGVFDVIIVQLNGAIQVQPNPTQPNSIKPITVCDAVPLLVAFYATR